MTDSSETEQNRRTQRNAEWRALQEQHVTLELDQTIIINRMRVFAINLVKFYCDEPNCDWDKVLQQLHKIKDGCNDVINKINSRRDELIEDDASLRALPSLDGENEPLTGRIIKQHNDEFMYMDCKEAKDVLRKTLRLFTKLVNNETVFDQDRINKMRTHFEELGFKTFMEGDSIGSV